MSGLRAHAQHVAIRPATTEGLRNVGSLPPLEYTPALIPRTYFVLLCVHFTSTFLKETFRFDFRRM